jgi:outer membrane receptor for ferrienterochelin and colicins
LGNYYYSHDFNGNFNYDWFKKGIIINANYKFTGKYPQFFIDTEKNIIEGYISGYHNLDFTISKSLFRKSMVISAGGKNLFGNTNILASQTGGEAHSGGSGSSPVGWGRTIFISLSYKFAKL